MGASNTVTTLPDFDFDDDRKHATVTCKCRTKAGPVRWSIDLRQLMAAYEFAWAAKMGDGLVGLSVRESALWLGVQDYGLVIGGGKRRLTGFAHMLFRDDDGSIRDDDGST